LEDALRDGDPIRAVIRETALNQDGKTPTITSPSREAQEALIRTCYENAGLNPLNTTYVEAHGTGTPTGDPIEAGAIGAVFAENRPQDKPLLIGSIKSNIGHLESTAGLAAILKVVLAFENGYIPPSIYFKEANPAIPLEKWKLKVRETVV
jgi:acyl transferase domain-containing protein